MNPRVSIVIACAAVTDYTLQCVRHCCSLDYDNYEILLYPDEAVDIGFPEVRVIPTGHIPPSDKRDMAIAHADGELIAFIDDDAYPVPQWLSEAVKHFRNDAVGAVGGPAVTPSEDSIAAKASGYVYSSFAGGGTMTYRYVPGQQREVDDYPSCNFIVRTSVFRELGGFNTTFWPGEDTKLCLEITQKLGKKIIYAPEVLVCHHRRKLFRAHLRQIWSYAVHRGYFVKQYPGTSLRLTYFIPSLFCLMLVLGILLSFFSPTVLSVFLAMVGLYLVLVLLSGMQKGVGQAYPLVLLGIIVTHLAYGAGFIKGILSRKMSR